MKTNRIALASATVVAVGSTLVTAAGAASSPAFISGQIVAVSGSTFTISTSLSPTGKSKVSVGSKTTMSEQKTGTLSNLKKGVCVSAAGTTSGTKITATRISITSSCANRPATGGPRGGGGGAGGVNPNLPANAGFAIGTVSSRSGSTVVVKTQTGSTTVIVSSKAQIMTGVNVKSSALKLKLCAFVRGTSSDGEKSVQAELVQLNPPVNGTCTGPRGRP
ncbi:MAG TPA: hypothetical protein VH210_07310 [Gaiellaceae bacterium]|jgi:hypothetical protein|nr:hypothetical protein [Gaiellaceae bacterium]